MSIVGMFGPQSTNAATSMPNVGIDKKRYPSQTWVKDASAPGRNDGTVLDAAFFNRIIGNLERLVTRSGIAGRVGDLTLVYNAVTQLITNAVAKVLRFDGPQELTEGERGYGRQNLGLHAVASSGDYDDLSNLPNFGSVNPGWGIEGGGSQIGNINIAVKQSDLDARYVTYGGTESPAPFEALAENVMNINGAFEINTANPDPVVLTATGALQFNHLVDCTIAAIRGSFVASAQLGSAPTGMPGYNALYVSVTTAQAVLGADDELTIMLPIEASRVSRMMFGTPNAQAMSLGFWISSNRTGDFSGSIMNASKTRSYPFTFNIPNANTPVWVPIGIPGISTGTWPPASGVVGLYVCICLAGGANRLGVTSAWATTTSPGKVGVTGTVNGVAATTDVFRIGQIMLVPGNRLPSGLLSPRFFRPQHIESELARRYYRTSEAGFDSGFSGDAVSGATYQATYSFLPPMCGVPNVTLTTNSHALNFPAAVGTVFETTPSGFSESRTASASGAGRFRSNWIADARLT